MRNNNPGNIRHSASHWQGQSETQTDSAFVQFDTMAYGVRALGRLLQTYQSKYNLQTVAQIIARWAPPNENNTGAYAKAVASLFNGNIAATVHTNYEPDLTDIVQGIIEHENGLNLKTIQPYENAIASGVKMCMSK